LSHPYSSRNYPPSALQFRINHKIRAREIRVIGVDGKQEGIMSLNDALTKARANDVDLVEIAPNATPPVCRLVDYGKFRYEQSKKDKDSRRHQHANKVKEIQLSPTIDPHDFKVKLTHATNFLCEEMKVKLTLRFRGREMAHQDIGFQTVNSFIKELIPYGHPDSPPKLIGRGINVMMSPLPRTKRAKNPHEVEAEPTAAAGAKKPASKEPNAQPELSRADEADEPVAEVSGTSDENAAPGFVNNPFVKLDVNATP
jgi:translation initiation factor IF-3